jgi:hypothetical protein
MPVTMQQVLDALNPDEPNYFEAHLGSEALPHLENLVKSVDPMIESKATYLVSLIKDKRSADILKVAAAAGGKNLSLNLAKDILSLLQNDQDARVRKQAHKSLSLSSK